MDETAIRIWVALGAPACAAYGVAAANREEFSPPVAKLARRHALAIVVVAALVVMTASSAGEALKRLVLATAFVYLAAFDLRAMAVPVLPALALIGLGIGVGMIEGTGLEHIMAALAGGSAFATIEAAYRSLRGRSGLGLGDALVAALIGAWIGGEALAWSVALGGVLGLLFALSRTKRDEPLPFVPALAAGAAIVLIWQGTWNS